MTHADGSHLEVPATLSHNYTIRRYHRKADKKGKRLNYAADFETTTDPGDCRVWGWGLCPITDDWQTLGLDNVDVGQSLQVFLEEVVALGNTVIYFHNLKFDGRFILAHLFAMGYEHTTEKSSLPGTFKSLISNTGQFYTLTVTWETGYTTEFRDSLKKLPMSVADVATAFAMETAKGEIDYRLPRPEGWKITADEKVYIQTDVLIIARALGQQFKVGLQKLTVGADALWEFKQLTGKKQYDTLFPTFSHAMDAEIRRAYRGGFTYADPRFTGRITRAGKVFDVNSLYPFIMYDRPCPYGMPEWVDGYPEPTARRPLTIFSFTFTARLKPGHIPCIQIKGNSRFMPTDYLTEITEPTTLMVTNVDYQLMLDHYDVRVLEFIGGWRFLAVNGVFNAYIDKWMSRKKAGTGGVRSLAKLQLTSLYGKFATNPDVTGKIPYLDDTGTVRLHIGAPEQRDPVYTPAGVFITSFARDLTIRAAQANYDTFAYADTDSLHLLTDELPDLHIDPGELGAWKHELDFDAAYYIRAKAYLEYGKDPYKDEPKTFHNAIAGVPTYMSAALTFEDLHRGTTITVTERGKHVQRLTGEPHNTVMMHGKLTPHAYPGGIVLEDTPFELKL